MAGDPLSIDAVITEVNALARTHLNFEIIPGLPDTTGVPTYAGLPRGSSPTGADVRDPNVDWAALAAAPGPLILHATAGHLADAARTLVEYGLAENTPAVVDRARHHLPAAFGGDHAGRLGDKAILNPPSPPVARPARCPARWSSPSVRR